MAEGEGLVSSLTLDIADALAKVGDIESALAAATTNIPVTVDTSGVDAAITDAVGAVDPTTTVTGDATEVTGAIDAAVAGADTQAVVTGDANEVTSAIDAAVGAADSQIEVTADTSQAQDALTNLDASAQDAAGSLTSAGSAGAEGSKGMAAFEGAALGAEGSARGLLGPLGEAGIAVAGLATVTAGLFDEAVKAVGGEQRLTQAFGDQAAAIQTINVGNLNEDLGTLAQSLGSTRSEIDNAAANLQNFGTAAGASAQQAEATTEQIIALAARSVALNPQLGSVADAADRLATVLASGRTRGLVPFNISLNAQQIQQEALIETGKQTVTELSRYELAAAGATLATQRYGDQLAQTIERGTANPIIQLQALRAEFTNAAEEIGKPLIAPVFEALQSALPLAITLAQTFADVMRAVLPIVNLVLDVIGLIPQNVISMGATFLALGFAIQLVTDKLVAMGVAVETVGAAAPFLAALTAAFVIYQGVTNSAAEEQRKFNAMVDNAKGSLDNLDASVEQNLVSIEKQADANGQLADILNREGKTYADLAQAQIAGSVSSEQFAGATLDAAKAAGVGFDGLVALTTQLRVQSAANQEAADEQLKTAVASDELTQAQVDQAESTSKNKDGTDNYLGALNLLQPQLVTAKANTDAAAASDAKAAQDKQAAIDAANKQQQALATLGDTAPGVALALAGINTTLGSQVPGLETLAVNIGNAKLSNDQIKAIADGFGVSADALSGFVKNVNDAIDSMNKDAVSKLPAVTDGFDRIVKFAQGIPDAFDPKALIKAFQDQIGAVQDFENNIAILQNAGLNNLVQLAEKEGPQATAALVKGIAEGGPALGQQLNDTYGQATQQLSDQVPAFFDKVNTQVALQTGLIGKLATDAFGETFRIEAPTETQLQIAFQKTKLFGIPFAQALKDTAGAGAVAYQQAIGALPGTTQATIDGVTQTIGAAQPGVQGAGAGLGGAISTGVGQGVAPAPGTVEATINQIEPTIQGAAEPLRVIAFNEGFFIGLNFTQGLATGIVDPGSVAQAENAATIVTQAVVTAAKVSSRVRSPSEVFIEIGQQMGAGLAIGLESSVTAVSSASGRMLNAAIPNVSKVNPVAASGGITFANGAIVVNLPAGATSQQAFDAGKQVGSGILESIAGRSLSVQVRSL